MIKSLIKNLNFLTYKIKDHTYQCEYMYAFSYPISDGIFCHSTDMDRV